MNPTTSAPQHPPAGSPPKRRTRKRSEQGLTTLEWLLIVAAVAGLAALAVVIVTNVTENTAKNLSQTNSRQVAYDLATTQLSQRWTAETPTTNKEAERINREYAQDCRQLGIIYTDVGMEIFVKPGKHKPPNPGWDTPPICTLT